MSLTTVQDTAVDPSNNPIGGALVRVTLVTGTDQLPGYASAGTIMAPETVVADATGHWTLGLVPNVQITPANTYYQIVVAGKISNIVVPAGGGPYSVAQILVTPPPTPAAVGITALQVALAGSVVGSRAQINLIQGSGATLTVADNAVNNRVDVTVASTGGVASAQLDPGAAALGLRLAVLDMYDTDGNALGLSAGTLILNRKWVPSAMSLGFLGTWMRSGGVTPTGANGMCILDSAGNLLGQTADMSTEMALSDQYVEKAITGGPIALTANTSIYLGILAHYSGNPTITGKALSGGGVFTAINGFRPSIFLTGQAAFPASVNLATAIVNTAGYCLYAR